MLLVMDVGNTNIKIGLFDGDTPVASWRVGSKASRTADEYGVIISNLFVSSGYRVADVKGVIMSSVMPGLNYTLEHMCRYYFHCAPLVVGAGIKTGINIKYETPQSLGADRIVNSVAASKLYGAPVIVVDFGTATTFSVVDRRGDFVGGAIAPGVKLAADALVQSAAKLPKIELTRPETVISRSTVKNMQSGIVYGFVGMVDYLLRRMKKELGDENVKVVATGGLSELIGEDVKAIDKVDRTLTLVGLKLIYQLNQSAEGGKEGA